MKKSLVIIPIIVLVAFGLHFWQKNESTKSKKSIEELSSREVALSCTTDMATEFHIHPELRIFIKYYIIFLINKKKCFDDQL